MPKSWRRGLLTARIVLSSLSLLDGCWYCGEKAEEWDHIVPKKLNGKDEIENLVPACSWCNGRKSGKTLHEFRKYLKEHGRNSEFDVPDPVAVLGTGYFKPGMGWRRFESLDGALVITDFQAYLSRLSSYVRQPKE